MNEISWTLLPFEALKPTTLYDLLRLRSEVFVVEQHCVFLDMDDKDQHCYHLLGFQEDKLVAYTRLVPPGVIYPEPSIGRVVTSPSVRRTGLGRVLMEKSIEKTRELFGGERIVIGAQLYLENFYSSLGFVKREDVYLEDDIEHIKMTLDRP